MATIAKIVDDLDGTEVAEGKGETVVFAMDGQDYEIDLSDKNAKAFRAALKQYVDAGRPVQGRRRAVNPEATAIREWARSNGVEVPERGRLPQEVVEKFNAATKGDDSK